MNSYNFHIEPRDLLFMRDGRPMEASDAGLGANWPRPDQVYSAFINTFHSHWPQQQSWEGHRHNINEKDSNRDSSFRFGALKTAGPFPVKGKEIYLPCPLDLSADGEGNLYPMKLASAEGTNMPFKYSFSSSKIGKCELPHWISASDYQKYLKGEIFKPKSDELYYPERNIGIAIDPSTGTTKEHQLYQAEYLRLAKDVKLAVKASCCQEGADAFDKMMVNGSFEMIIGGQQGVCIVSESPPISISSSCCAGNILHSFLLRWTLISPAVFPAIESHSGGWLPNWVDDKTWQVLLPKGNTERKSGEKRDAWRKRISIMEKLSATLIAARVGKPLIFSGWDLKTGAKPTYMAVPAGSVYIFECKDNAQLSELSEALSWNGGSGNEIKNRRSTLFGEKGFGLGICSQFKI